MSTTTSMQVTRGDEPLQLEHFTLGPRGLMVRGKRKPTLGEWAGIGDLLKKFHDGIQWMIGDWLNTGESLYGEQASQVIDAEHWTESTVRVYRWVASKVPYENRRQDLSFTHHQVVAEMPPAEQKKWLKRAADGETTASGGQESWPVARLKTEIEVAESDNRAMHHWLLVRCRDEQDATTLAKELAGDGRVVKTSTSTAKLVGEGSSPEAQAKKRRPAMNTKPRRA